MTSMQNPTPTIIPGQLSGMTIRFTPIDPMRLINQYKWLLVIIIVVGLILGFILTKVLERVHPLYTAASQLQVSPELSDAYSIETGSFRSEDTMEIFKYTQMHIIKSSTVLSNTIKNVDVRDTNWFKSFNNADDALLELEDEIVVMPIRKSSILEVRLSIFDPDDAARIVNALVDEYMTMTKTRNQNLRVAQTAVYRQSKQLLDEDILRVRRKMNTIIPPTDLDAIMGQHIEIELDFANLKESISETVEYLSSVKSSHQSLIKKKQEGIVDFSPEDEAQIEQDPKIRVRDDLILRLKEDLRALQSSTLGPKHKTILSIKNQIQSKEIERENEKQRLLAQLQDVKLSETESAVQMLTSQFAEQTKQLGDIRIKRDELYARLQDYEIEKLNLEKLQTEREQDDDMIKTIEIVRKNPHAVQVKVLFIANPDYEMTFPDIYVMLIATPLLLITIVASFLVVKELLDQRIKSPTCTKLLPCDNLLGVIPLASDDPSEHDVFDLVTAKNPTGLISDAFRQFRNEVAAKLSKNKLKTIMLAGSQPNSGTSSVTANLATSFALNNSRTVILDINLQRPSQYKLFDLDNEIGVCDVINDKIPLQQAIKATRVDNLSVITTGNSQRLRDSLQSSTLQNIIEQLEQQFDLVLIDAPPLSIVSDSIHVASRIDAFILVMRAIQDKRGLVIRMLRQLKNSNVNVLGMVLNGVRSSTGGYYRKNYQAFYDYDKSTQPLQTK